MRPNLAPTGSGALLGGAHTWPVAGLRALAEKRYCYLTTTGRVSGEPREIEIWFGLRDSTLFMLAEGRERSNWVRNLIASPEVKLRIGERTFAGRARIVAAGTDEDATARRLLFDKYSPVYSGDLAEWRDTALVVAVDLPQEPGGGE